MISTLDATTDAGRISAAVKLARQIDLRLKATGYLTFRDVACEVRDGIAHLNGCLRSHHLKQIAQAVAIEVDGIRAVDNRIVVVPLGTQPR